MKNSITERIKITKKGKIKRRALALGHNRTKKRKIHLLRKKNLRDLKIKYKKLKTLAKIS